MRIRDWYYFSIIIVVIYRTCDAATCTISTHDTNDRQPLIIDSCDGYQKIAYPDATSKLIINDTRTLRLICPTDLLSIKSTIHNVNSATLVCFNNGSVGLRIGHSEIVSSLGQIFCANGEPVPILRIINDNRMEIGYQLNVFDFLPLIDSITVDRDTLQIIKLHAKIIPEIVNRQRTDKGATPLRMGNIFRCLQTKNHPFDAIYRKDYQFERFMRIFEDDALLVNKYFSATGDDHLIPSQLITEKDFFYHFQQTGASFHENTVPMWHGVANGNWELVGEFVRKLAADSFDGLDVWSGGIGVLALPDRRGCLKKIYLAEDETTARQLIPIPKLLYKYVYDAKRRRGLVIVTINDPHLVYGLTNDYIVCQELIICRELNPNFNNVRRGFTYCCALKSFRHFARSLDLPAFF